MADPVGSSEGVVVLAAVVGGHAVFELAVPSGFALLVGLASA